MLPLQARALELQARMARHSEHMQRFGALGTKAKDVLAALVEVSSSDADSQGAALLLDANERIRDLVDEIRAMTEAASEWANGATPSPPRRE